MPSKQRGPFEMLQNLPPAGNDVHIPVNCAGSISKPCCFAHSPSPKRVYHLAEVTSGKTMEEYVNKSRQNQSATPRDEERNICNITRKTTCIVTSV